MAQSSSCVRFEESIGRAQHDSSSVSTPKRAKPDLLSFRIAVQPQSRQKSPHHQQKDGDELASYIATINGSGVHCLTLRGKSVKSWSVSPSLRFETPVISLANGSDQLLCAVVNDYESFECSALKGKKQKIPPQSAKQSIWSWPMSAEMGALDRLASKHSLTEYSQLTNIVALYSITNIGGNSLPVVVNEDGTLVIFNQKFCSALSTLTPDRSSTTGGKGDYRVIYTQLLREGDDNSCNTILVLEARRNNNNMKKNNQRRSDESTLLLSIYRIDGSNSLQSVCAQLTVSSELSTAAIEGIAGVSYEPTGRHLTILDGGTSQWHVYQLSPDLASITQLSCISLRNIRFTKPTALVALSAGYVAMIVRGSITIWNYENGTPFARRPKVFSVMPTHVNLFHFDSFLFATTENELQIFPVNCQPATLFDTIKQSRMTLYYVAGVTSNVASATGVMNNKLNDERDKVAGEQSIIIERLLDRQITPTAVSFEHCFFDWINGDVSSSVTKITNDDEEDVIAELILASAQGNSSAAQLAKTQRLFPELTRAVFKRCTLESSGTSAAGTATMLSMWPETVVEYLIRNGAVSQRNYDGPDLLQFLYTRGHHWTALLAMQFVQDISELDCVFAMKFYLSRPEKELEEILMERDYAGLFADNEMLTETGSEVFLRCLLSMPFDEVFMTRALKRLGSDEMGKLLQFTKRWVQRFNFFGADEIEKRFNLPAVAADTSKTAVMVNNDFKLNLSIICQFLSCLIDAHTASLIISPSYHQTLAEIRGLINQETELCGNIETLRGVLLDVYRVISPTDSISAMKSKISKQSARHLSATTALYSIQNIKWWGEK